MLENIFFLKAFTFIFFAALPGRTTFVLIMLASRGHARKIFFGAATAFAIQCLISVAIGQVMSFFAPALVQLTAGVLFLFFSYQFWREARKPTEVDTVAPLAPSFRSIFFLVFAAEWGDVSQLAIASFSSQTPEKVTVLIAAVSAMWIITAIALAAGSFLGKFVEGSKIQKVASLGFLGVGLYLIFQGGRAYLTP